MVPLVAPCHVVAASVWDCDNCIPVVELLGCAANRELPAGSSAHVLTTLAESLVDNHSMLGWACLFTTVLQMWNFFDAVNERMEFFHEFSANVGTLHGILWEKWKWLHLVGPCQMGVETDVVDSPVLLMERYHPKRPWAEWATHHKSEGASKLYLDNKQQAPGGNTVSNQCHNSTSNPVSKTHWLFRQHSGNDPATNHILYRNALCTKNSSRFMPHTH